MTYTEQLHQMVKEETLFRTIVPLRPEQCAWHPQVIERRAINNGYADHVLTKAKKVYYEHTTRAG